MLLGTTDAAFLRGVLSHNPHLEPQVMHALIQERQRAIDGALYPNRSANVQSNPQARALLGEMTQQRDAW